MERVRHALLIFLILIALPACNLQRGQTTQAVAVTQIVDPAFTQSGSLPRTEDEVPRVTVQEAKAAFDSGKAIIVDVRNPAAYEASHIAGAISVPLAEIEEHPINLNIDKNQWIITYCT